MFRPLDILHRSILRPACTQVLPSLHLCAHGVSALGSLPLRCHPERNAESAFLGSISLFVSHARPAKGTLPAVSAFFPPTVTIHESPITKPFRIRTYKKCALNPFGIRTSKTRDLKSFRIRTYKKTPRGVPRLPSVLSLPLPAAPLPRHSSRGKQLRHGRAILPSTFNFRLSTLQVQSPHLILGDR